MAASPSLLRTCQVMAAIHADCFELPPPWTAQAFQDVLSAPGSFFYQEANTGFIIGRIVCDEAELLTLAVAPAARRQGIAQRLLAQFLAHVQKAPVEYAFLEVSADNHAALHLYRRYGFEHIARRRAYYRAAGHQAQDALILRLNLIPKIKPSFHMPFACL